ncbi:hypothetical protein ATANTOWER_002428, partial [Ataeniobius toweri]|nr:hypothetical protein [Ataeniobius toweri]
MALSQYSHFHPCVPQLRIPVDGFKIKEWVDQMQKELVSLADTATAGKSLTQIFLRNKHLYTVEENDAEELVARAARNIEQLLRKRSAALE